MRKTLLILVFSIFLITSGSAQETNPGSFDWDTAGDLSCAISSALYFANPGCIPILGDDIQGDSLDDLQDDLFAKSLLIKDDTERFLTERKSFLNTTYGNAISSGKIRTTDLLNNGTSRSKAKNLAINPVDDWYTSQQLSIINWRNKNIIRINRTINNEIKNNTGADYGDFFEVQTMTGASSSGWQDVRDIEVNKAQETLFNGSKKEKFYLSIEAPYKGRKDGQCPSGSAYYYLDFNQTSYTANGYGYGTDCGVWSSQTFDTKLSVTDSSGNRSIIYESYRFENILDTLDSRELQAEQNVVNYVDKHYDKYSQGELSVSDVLGPLEALKKASTNYEDTGYYSYLATSFAQQGLAYNESYAFKIEWKNPNESSKTQIGQLFLEENDWNQQIETGKTYDASNKTAWFIHSTDGGKAKETSLKGTFTVKEMTNKETGETINTTTVQSTEFRTTSTDKLEKQLKQLRERQETLIEDLANTGGGGNLDSFFGDLADSLNIPKEWIWAFVGLLIVALFLVTQLV